MQITAIILTGGKSSRMGTDKALLELDGKTLLSRAVDLCSQFCDEILISSDAEEHRVGSYRLVEDEVKDCGPMGGIYSCLKASSNQWNFVLSVDAPFVTKDFIAFLKGETNNFDAVVPLHDGKKEPLIAFYRKTVLSQIEVKIGEGNYKLHFLLQEVNTNFVESGEWFKKYPELFRNLNYPEDIGNIML
ncbi:molybdenum cofactor guanylyltransferase [Maribellus sp. YY47]|uniref:molybdenum cofactor guanylyltransferase n=1 Tax=Maribellus sp. YY47 TaxID=2929486 RepID=UPI0020014BB9|nr:molybdenum cofactor guanylyltransferase [Maribellus sp. YY47]MCK3682556.1 molybdenum cofactor guanylyltransferase [Maribellus sp. YY47]